MVFREAVRCLLFYCFTGNSLHYFDMSTFRPGKQIIPFIRRWPPNDDDDLWISAELPIKTDFVLTFMVVY